MDENTNVQNIDVQDEEIELSDVPAFDDEDEVFDMDMANKEAESMFEQQQLEEISQFKEIEGFASIFPDNWVIVPPTDRNKVNQIIKTQLARKSRR